MNNSRNHARFADMLEGGMQGQTHTISDRESVLVVDLQEAGPQTDISAVPMLCRWFGSK